METLLLVAVGAVVGCNDVTASDADGSTGSDASTGSHDSTGSTMPSDTPCGRLCARELASGCGYVALATCSTTKVWQIDQFDQASCEAECNQVDGLVPSSCVASLDGLIDCAGDASSTCDANGVVIFPSCQAPYSDYLACCPPPACDPSTCNGCETDCDFDTCYSCCSGCNGSSCEENCNF